MVGIRFPIGLVVTVGSCTSHPGVLGSIPKREEPGKTGAPCVKVPGSSRVPVRDERTHLHRPRLVVSHSTCPPLFSSHPANSFVIGPAVINTHTHIYRFCFCKNNKRTNERTVLGVGHGLTSIVMRWRSPVGLVVIIKCDKHTGVCAGPRSGQCQGCSLAVAPRAQWPARFAR